MKKDMTYPYEKRFYRDIDLIVKRQNHMNKLKKLIDDYKIKGGVK